LYGDPYFVVFILILLIFIIAAVVISLFLFRKRTASSPTLGNIRQQIEGIQKSMEDMQRQIWQYGTNEEQQSKNWRTSCLAVAQKAVTVLQSCWLEREENEYAQAVYDELLMGLRRVGIEEAIPTLGETINEEDTPYRIAKKEGLPPFHVSKVIYPGYNFKIKKGETYDGQDAFILERAVVEITGKDRLELTT
jgi:hypothetical protein